MGMVHILVIKRPKEAKVDKTSKAAEIKVACKEWMKWKAEQIKRPDYYVYADGVAIDNFSDAQCARIAEGIKCRELYESCPFCVAMGYSGSQLHICEESCKYGSIHGSCNRGDSTFREYAKSLKELTDTDQARAKFDELFRRPAKPTWHDMTKEEVKEHLFEDVWTWNIEKEQAAIRELFGYWKGTACPYYAGCGSWRHASLTKPE
jgi:hypothetical protein